MGEFDEMPERDGLIVRQVLSKGTLSTDETHEVIAEDHTISESESWRLTALAMELSRDDALKLRDILIDVAAIAAIIPCLLEEGRDPKVEIAMLREALSRYTKARQA